MRSIRNMPFTFWVLVFVRRRCSIPAAFRSWFGTDLKLLIVPLIQIITFGMGTTLSGQDFKNVLTMPWPVLIGIILQFTVMPLRRLRHRHDLRLRSRGGGGHHPHRLGLERRRLERHDLSRRRQRAALGDDHSSTTLLSPIVTPFWMKTLAGRFIPVPFTAMMLSIFNMIIIPIVAGLIANRILYSKKAWARKASIVAFDRGRDGRPGDSAGVSERTAWGPLAVLKSGVVLGFILLGLAALAKLIISLVLHGPENWMDQALPSCFHGAICFIIAIITAQSRDQLLSVGLVLIAAAVLHNGTGYFLGYWGARLARLDESACRAVAMEVGMQNGGMASGLAIDVLKSTSAALAPAIFGPWMNVSGSLLAGWWRRRPVSPKTP